MQSDNTLKNGKKLFSISLILAALIFSLSLVAAAQGKIAFSSNRDSDYEIYVMNADGDNPVNITNDPADGRSP